MVGQSSALYACGNPDAIAYLSDEVQVHFAGPFPRGRRISTADEILGR